MKAVAVLFVSLFVSISWAQDDLSLTLVKNLNEEVRTGRITAYQGESTLDNPYCLLEVTREPIHRNGEIETYPKLSLSYMTTDGEAILSHSLWGKMAEGKTLRSDSGTKIVFEHSYAECCHSGGTDILSLRVSEETEDYFVISKVILQQYQDDMQGNQIIVDAIKDRVDCRLAKAIKVYK